MSKAMNDAMVWHWQRGLGKFGDDAVHPMFAAAFTAAWGSCRERCFELTTAEHVGSSIEDSKLCDADFAYNNALKDARNAICVA